MASKLAAANKGDGEMSGEGNKTPAVKKPHQTAAPLKCPRCDSTNTKFCYYNNYSQSQPRYFCKTCRRYWTKGGALRTVPVGGSCRRRKIMKSSSAARCSWEYATTAASEIGGLGYFNGLGFHLGGIKIPSYNSSAAALFNQLAGTLSAMPPPNPRFSLDQLPPLPCSSSLLFDFNFTAVQEMGSLAPPIEAVSTINQDFLQWNLQQQMLGVLSAPIENQIQNPEPILFHQNPEIPTPPSETTFGSSSSRIAEATDWLFDDDVTFPPPAYPTPTKTFENNGNGNAAADDWDDLVQASWATNFQFNEFSALP